MFIVKKKYERLVSSGSYQAVNARKFKRGNVMEKSRGKAKREKKNKKKKNAMWWGVVEMN